MPENKELIENALKAARKRDEKQVFGIFFQLMEANDIDTLKVFLTNKELSWCCNLDKNIPGQDVLPLQYALQNNHFEMAQFFIEQQESNSDRPRRKP